MIVMSASTHTDTDVNTAQIRPDLRALAALVQPDSIVLDLGCGEGVLLEYLSAVKNVRGRGIELHEEGVRACIRRGLSVRQGNLHEGLDDYPDQSVDYVVLSQTLHYLNNPSRVIAEMMRVGKRSIVSIPNWGHWKSRLELLVTGRVPESPDLPDKWTSERRWQAMTIAGFRRFCRERGIGIVEDVYLGPKGTHSSKAAANLLAITGIFVLQPSAAHRQERDA